VGITPSHLAATGTWDQAPVQVGITTATVPDALVVPVTALLARSGGGYAVEVVGPSNHLVPVSLGLFDDADGLVQVTGSRLAAGQEVVVPAI
jgi:multidrug efflux pump subunit AcrA (membrane-fusion protein)